VFVAAGPCHERFHGKAFHRFAEGSNALLADISVARSQELDRSLQLLVRAFEDYQRG